MIGIRERRYGSWLDRASAACLGTKFGHRLWERCKGNPGVFVMLTYDRAPYEDALDLYRTHRERQHVALFIRRLSKRLGVSLKGKWVRKMEFQEGGWVHWHLVILGERFIYNSVIEECWRHGHTKTKGLNKQRALYMTKYVSKGNCGLPAFIWGEAPRSVKVISASPGFWGEQTKPNTYCPIYAKYGPQRPSKWPAYVPIGKRMEQNRGCTVARAGPGQRPHAIRSVCCEPFEMLRLVARVADRCIQHRGWLWFDVDEEYVEEVAALVRSDIAAAACRREWSQRLADGKPAPRSGALNLRGTRKPDAPMPIPSWLTDWWQQQAMANWLPGATK